MAERDPQKTLTVDSETSALVSRVAEKMGVSELDAIREAVRKIADELDRGDGLIGAREMLRKFWREHPLPPPTGLRADKAFFDELSGDL